MNDKEELQKLIDELVVEETQLVSFSFMSSIGKILSQDLPSVNEIEEKERIIVPEELIPFLP